MIQLLRQRSLPSSRGFAHLEAEGSNFDRTSMGLSNDLESRCWKGSSRLRFAQAQSIYFPAQPLTRRCP
jgi:hypothetical protein